MIVGAAAAGHQLITYRLGSLISVGPMKLVRHRIALEMMIYRGHHVTGVVNEKEKRVYCPRQT